MMASHLRDQAKETSSTVVLHDTIVNPLLRTPGIINFKYIWGMLNTEGGLFKRGGAYLI